MDLQDFSITIGPYHGTFTMCGMASNYLSSGETGTYNCSSNARGSAITISISVKIEQHLALCQVAVFGEGNILEEVDVIRIV